MLLHYGWKAVRAPGSRYSRRAVLAGAVIGLVAVLGLGFLVARGSATATVFARIPSLIPGMEEGATVSSSLWQLWDRFGYGTAAVGMIREHPLEGVDRVLSRMQLRAAPRIPGQPAVAGCDGARRATYKIGLVE